MVGLADIDSGPDHFTPHADSRFVLVRRYCLIDPVEHPADTSVTSDKTRISISSQGAQEDRADIPSKRPNRKAISATPGPLGSPFSLTEGDLITGAGNGSAIGTLVERATGFVVLLHLPNTHKALDVQEAITATMSTLPRTLRRTLTWDQGQEMANHVQITAATGLDIYFCDPHSPWQRGLNENTNGLLRQYFPKFTDLSGYHPAYLEFVAAELNNRPRKRLGWRSPAEALEQLLSEPDSNPPGVALAS
ncbi:IS30 family transposase [Nocardia sp. NPDC019255]|uniref:IS30 family transposase n=1 Tax=Nocardia sp. NPDC019255 TaxID=3154591 RepID=UPI0033D72D34